MKRPPLLPSYPLSDLRELLLVSTEKNGKRAAIKSKVDGEYRATSYDQLKERVERLATALFECGLESGDRVGVLSENRTQWCVAYLAAVASGFVVVPIDKDLTTREIKHILNFGECRALVCSGDHATSLKPHRSAVPSLEKVVSMEGEAGDADCSFQEALDAGKAALEAGNRSFQEAEVNPDDVAAIIFTSGTTGSSKGVMLTHKNIAANIVGTSEMVSIADEHDALLSVLPLHHTYECTGGFLMALYQGSTVCHAENLRRIAENMVETRATIMLGVPLLFETIYRRIADGMKKKGEKKIRTAMRICSLTEKVGINIRRRVFKEVHKKFGGRLRLMISGGAAIDPAVSKGYRDLGMDFIQGYGMTEFAPIIAVNRVNAFRDAAVGLPLPGAEIEIRDGEIVVRGDCVMKGYYQNPEATSETIQDGWLHTGDLGYFDEDGFLYVNGRKKSVIVTANGKNVYPEELETILNQSPFILEALAWGGPEIDPSQVEVQAIVVPNSDAFDEKFGAAAYDDSRIDEVIGQEVKRLNQKLANYKRIKKFTLRSEEFEKTTTKKIKRFLYTGKPQTVSREEVQETKDA